MGVKATKSHSTATDATWAVYETLVNYSDVRRIGFGIIKPCRTLRGKRRIRIIDEGGALLLRIRDFSTVQELRVYLTSNKTILEHMKKQLVAIGFIIN